MAGAQGVVLAPAAALDVGAGLHGPPQASRRPLNVSRRVPVYELLDRQDAQVLASAMNDRADMVLNDTAVQACREPLARPHPQDGSGSEAEYGCNAWMPDEQGQSIHSGDNRNFNRMVSSLELSVDIVREQGFVLFRYQVDAEEGYDGFSFEVDWREALQATSLQRNWTDVRINLTKGAHILRWQYAKDYSGYAGMDRAQLQLVQVVGTRYADLECFPCHGSGTHSAGGADHCNACKRNQYLEPGKSADLAKCWPCPAGKWSVPGSISAASCMAVPKCTEKDVKVSLSPCRDGKQHQVRSWIPPVICDVNDSSATALLQSSHGEQACAPCEPNTWRPQNAECVPNVTSCPAGHYAVTELVLSRWGDWPKNLSQEVISPHGVETGTADVPGGWALNNGTLHMTMGLGSLHITDKLDARLHLDVQETLSPGSVNFTMELPRAEMWGSDVRFFVDGVASSNVPGAQVVLADVAQKHLTRVQVSAPLWPGRHRLTWSCSHSLLSHASQQVRLVRVAVQGVANAGASGCARCPSGQEVAPSGTSCRSCPPGHFLAQDSSSTRCAACSPGKFGETWAATACRACGQGTASGAGAISCDPKPVLQTRDFAAASKVLTPGEVVINATAAIQQWRAAIVDISGPLLVSGRKFYISLLRPAPPPGDEGGMAYVWEQVTRQDCQPADHHGSSVGGGAASSATAEAPPPTVVAVGTVLARVEAVALGELRGVRFTWKKDVNAQLQPKPAVLCPDAATMAAEALSGFSLMLRCDPTARIPEPLARTDAAGNAHLEHLRLAERRVGAFEPFAVCGMLDLQWPTLMACPPCQAQDFAAQLGPCDQQQMRFVTFKLMRPCIGGMSAPPGYRESCSGDDVQSAVKHVGKVVKEQYPMRAAVMSVAAVLLGCCLVCYATHLHRTYRRQYMQDGGL